MSRLAEALKKAGETFELFQRGEIGPCDSTPSAVPVPNLLPSSHCKVPSAVPLPGDTVIVDKTTKGVPPVEDKLFECTPKEVPPATPRVLTYTQKDVIDDHISIPAQHSLVRLSKNPETSADAVGMLEAVKSRQLEGIYCVNWEKPAQRAIKLGSNWWTVIPEGEDAVLMLDPEDLQDGPPMIAFRRSLHPDCGLFDDEESFPPENARLDAALMRTWETFKLWLRCELGPCDSSTIPVTNLVPPTVCKHRDRNFGTIRVRLYDRESRPMPEGVRFRVALDDQVVDGMTQQGGFAEFKGPVDATTCIISWHPVHFDEARPPDPEAFEYTKTIHLESITELVSPGKVRERLSNLGYSAGVSLEESVRAFQEDYNLDVNGDPNDPATKALLAGLTASGELKGRPPEPSYVTLFDEEA